VYDLARPEELLSWSESMGTSVKTYHIWTIGCQMNVADSALLASELEKVGYSVVATPQEADVLVLNTCVVRQSAEDRVIGRLTSLKPLRRHRPNMVLAVMGCLIGPQPAEELTERFPYVDLFLPPSNPARLLDYLRDSAAYYGEEISEGPEPSEARGARALGPREQPGRVTAYVPVIRGCNHFCSYCIVPYRRGREQSRPLDHIVAEVRDLVASGVREVTLLGQIVARYGHDLEHRGDGPPLDLADLLWAVSEVDGLWRIRFLTSYPGYFSDRILTAVAESPKVCEHIEVPVQAGHDDVLQRMRRGYTAADFTSLVRRIRSKLPRSSIVSDVIVGFPGETDIQFQETYDLLAALRLDQVHVAAYSPRSGTLAARNLVDDVPPEEKTRRLKAIDQLQAQIVGEINSRFVGRRLKVLVEDKHKGRWRGRTRTNKLVFFEHGADWRGQLVEVHISWAGPWSMQGEIALDQVT